VLSSHNMSSTSVEELHRYAIVSELARGKVVLEIGLSDGYGSNLVAQTARRVVGMGGTFGLVTYARTNHCNANLFIVGGRHTDIPLATGCVDLVMSFDGVERLDQGESMMAEIARVLRPGGIVIISSPHKYEYSEFSIHQNSSQFTPECMSDCESLLRSKFRNVAVFAQRTSLGSYVVPLVNKPLRSGASGTPVAGDFIPSQKEGGISGPCYVFAMGSNGALPPVRVGLFGTEGEALGSLQVQLDDTLAAVAEKERTISELNMQLLAVQQTIGWRTLTRVRKTRDWLLPVGSARRDFYWSVRRITEVLLDGGPRAVFRRIRHRLHLGLNIHDLLPRAPGGDDSPNVNRQYQVWLEHHQLKPADIERMRAALETFTHIPLISIVIPVYNTEEVWLRRAIESVQAQVCQNWEICMVNDASTKSHIMPILDGYAASDPRIRVKHLSKRTGITGASYEALAMARGEFVGLLDHDDELTPDALWEITSWLNRIPDLDLLYSDEDKLTTDGARVDPFFKPDWSPDLLLSMNYITHFAVFRRGVLESIGGFKSEYEGAQDHDLLLRFTEQTNRIVHIPKILYHWRMGHSSSASSASAKPFASESGRRAIEDALQRRGYQASVEILSSGRYRTRYKIQKPSLVSIIIPTKDQLRLLRQCLVSIEEKTSYHPYEIIIIDNNGRDPETIQYLDALSDQHRVLHYPQPFNFSAINNFGADQAKGEYLLFLNDDTQVIDGEWLAALVEQAQRPEVGAVGAKLLYPDNRIQHGGVILGIFGGAGHAFRNLPDNRTAYFGLADLARNCSAVTAACMMVSRKLFMEIGGFDEQLKVVYNDVDLCLRMRQRGYLILYTPFAVLYHFESATRGRLRPVREEELFCRRWDDVIRLGDPYYNPSLTLTREDWSLRL
jgi:glycosyltransferase involved in cell wall biosynthesis/2-polyprenyl-3-methyl-5-hydroxy-6-metoxy-1,4-benzoquinol methylase